MHETPFGGRAPLGPAGERTEPKARLTGGKKSDVRKTQGG